MLLSCTLIWIDLESCDNVEYCNSALLVLFMHGLSVIVVYVLYCDLI